MKSLSLISSDIYQVGKKANRRELMSGSQMYEKSSEWRSLDFSEK
jgi:hypothetical protein